LFNITASDPAVVAVSNSGALWEPEGGHCCLFSFEVPDHSNRVALFDGEVGIVVLEASHGPLPRRFCRSFRDRGLANIRLAVGRLREAV
jgi:hypothetical protein